ncbi:MAG: hypothetical protein JXA67_12075 [Micromonosporaceae bacterium]|nr:hypothetical protein [Micromonosporaceae bacterium]
MLVTLMPGADRMYVLDQLRQAAHRIIGQNHLGKPYEHARWVMESARALRGQISRHDLDQLFYAPIFHQFAAGTMVAQGLLEADIHERKGLLAAAADTLEEQITAWNVPAETTLAAVDTSVFLSHPSWTRDDDPAKVIASIRWAEDLNVGRADVLLIIPEVVIRELDRLKESGNKALRYRAQVTLAVIDRLLGDPYGTVTIQPSSPGQPEAGEWPETLRGGVQLKVFYDDATHRPLTDADAEIIDRVLAVQSLAGKSVRLVTMDTGMGLNARRAQLEVAKPTREIEEPPGDVASARSRRREAPAANGGRVQVTGQP